MNETDPRKIHPREFTNFTSLHGKIKFILQYAILSPSTHNTQPWLFKIENNICKVYFDPKYRLPEADPHGRDIFISIGCCVENIVLAAKYFGVFEKLELGQQQKERELLAIVYFKDNQCAVDDKYLKFVEAIPRRTDSRGTFKNEPIDKNLLNEIVKEVESEGYLDIPKIHFVGDKEKILEIANLTAEGLKMAYKRKSFRKEMSGWMNNSLTRKKEGIPGYALRMPFLISFILPTVVKFFNIGKVLAKLNYRSLSSVPLVTVITAKENNPIAWLKTGRLVERLMLEFNIREMQTSIFMASLEMGDLYKKVQKMVNTEESPHFLFVVGKVDSAHKLTPRHELRDKMMK